MGISSEITEKTSELTNPFEKGLEPAKVFIRDGESVDQVGNEVPHLSSLEYLALREKPSKEAMARFEWEDFPVRQEILTEVRMLEKETNLKALPAALVLVPVAVAIIGLSLRSIEGIVPPLVSGGLVSLGVIFAAIVILIGIKDHAHKETCLNAWIKALEDSHSRAIRFEDERNKQRAEEWKALLTDPTPSDTVGNG